MYKILEYCINKKKVFFENTEFLIIYIKIRFLYLIFFIRFATKLN